MRILGTQIDAIWRKEALDRVREMMSGDLQHHIVTPNPEMLVRAAQDPEFQKILNQASLRLPDGFGLQLASLLGGEIIPERITGTDFLDDLICLADETGHRVCFLGGENDVAVRAREHFVGRYPSLQIVHAESGGEIIPSPSRGEGQGEGAWQTEPGLLDRIRSVEPHILVVGLGHEKQEKWIADHLAQLPSVKIAMGVGGALDFWAGRVRRAPRWLRRIGLEWLWRLIVEPRRWRRIVIAVFIFPILVLRDRFNSTRF